MARGNGVTAEAAAGAYAMLDLFYLAIGTASLAILWQIAKACDRL